MSRRKATTTRVSVLQNVEIPLRDGTRTFAEVWVPEDGGAHPTILMRTPYGKELRVPMSLLDPRMAAARGYATVVQDCRGRGASEGRFEPFVDEQADGFDTIEWIASQEWSDGNVVMAGTSYEGVTQWLAAVSEPAALRAIAPAQSSDDYGEGWSYRDGVVEHGFLTSWSAAELAPLPKRLLDDPSVSWTDIDAAEAVAPWLRDWLANGPGSAFWCSRSVSHRRDEISVPVLVVAGWYDIFLSGSLQSFARSRDRRDRLIVGPWGHDEGALSHLVGDASVGIAGLGLKTVFRWVLSFYDAVLGGEDPSMPKVRAYALGARRWVDLESWPPAHGSVLTTPVGPGAFAVEPGRPVPTIRGRGLLLHVPGAGYGIADQRPLTARDDVHVAAHIGIETDTLLAGPIRLRLLVAGANRTSDRRMWVGTLCIRQPDGALHNLAEGVAATPGDEQRVVVDLGDTFALLPACSELVLLVAGSSFPRWPRPTVEGEQRLLEGSTLELATAPVSLVDLARSSGCR